VKLKDQSKVYYYDILLLFMISCQCKRLFAQEYKKVRTLVLLIIIYW